MPAYKHNSPKKKSNWVSRLKEAVGILAKGVKHSPAGKKYLAGQKKKKPPKGKKIAYYGQGRETADDILRRLKRKK
ncbi:hypothetical protein LCGC14_0447760 [marine sediment metagenome]|uniref:Uncharacterized protein n=1 Tax=marine sediment metagenome TaxID=412755 RepID=A0A0F9V5E7_9ZZZZ